MNKFFLPEAPAETAAAPAAALDMGVRLCLWMTVFVVGMVEYSSRRLYIVFQHLMVV